MKNPIFLILLIFTIIISCKKDKNDEAETSYPTYFPLKVGNYWVYQIYDIDSSGNATATNTYDSCYVEKDTSIHNETFFKVYRPSAIPDDATIYIRDSLHYLVNSDGAIIFSSQDFTNILVSGYVTATIPDTVCQVTLQMHDKNVNVIAPAGTFLTSNARKTYDFYPGWTQAGSPRYKHARFSENTGLVTETLTFYQAMPTYKERRLIRYHLN